MYIIMIIIIIIKRNGRCLEAKKTQKKDKQGAIFYNEQLQRWMVKWWDKRITRNEVLNAPGIVQTLFTTFNVC